MCSGISFLFDLHFPDDNLKEIQLIICFMDCACWVVSKKSSPYPRSSRFSHMLYSRCFTVLHFTFKSVVYSVKFLD